MWMVPKGLKFEWLLKLLWKTFITPPQMSREDSNTLDDDNISQQMAADDFAGAAAPSVVTAQPDGKVAGDGGNDSMAQARSNSKPSNV